MIEGGKIAFVGTQPDAEENYANAQQVDLAGKTLLSGFFDGHIHFSALGGEAMVRFIIRMLPYLCVKKLMDLNIAKSFFF